MDKYVSNEMLNDCLQTISELIKIESIKKAPTLNAPFGEEINNALLYILNKAKRFGFKTRNLDGYVGIIEMGNGKEELGIFVHVDVVPANDEKSWLYPPFSGKITQNAVWGRGALDNKGPEVSVLYAMKMLQEMSIKWNKRIKLVIGTDEESDWQCITHYKRKEKLPTFAFTPDGCFPVTNGEKGLLTLSYEKNISKDSIVLYIESGERYNTTPGIARAILSKNTNIERIDLPDCIAINRNSKGYEVIAKGREGASASPNNNNNAIHLLLSFLKRIVPMNDSFEKVITFYERYLKDTDGKGHHLKISDDISGALTLATVKLRVNKGHVQFVSNIRYPVKFKKDEILQLCKRSLQSSDFNWYILQHKESLYVPESHSYIKRLLDIYRDYFKRNEEPVSISGATYARAFSNMVAFGALIPGKPINAHESNEHVEISVIRDWINIYAKAIYELAALKEDDQNGFEVFQEKEERIC